MKRNLLLVNCYGEKAGEKIAGYREWLRAAAARAGIEETLREAADSEPLEASGDFAAVIISGSQKMAGSGEIEPGLLEFLQGNRRPLLGVCYGHQALARAFGARVQRGERKHLGDEEVLLNKTDPLLASFPHVFAMSESHEEIVARDNDLERGFMVLAENREGLVEAIRHREHPFYGVQFHPEKSGELGILLLVNFLNMIS
ncbi:MAG: gamma-glutamyl-gamma-aminobutyrate hydrolase family protein [Candidatus Aminicenantes bacterium]|nr:gamma-glutamyl-gamma-aminobutyrate hydrolase family protein [Candidatus Aminicenantes bacterium]